MSELIDWDQADSVMSHLLRLRNEVEALRADSLKYLERHLGHLERLLDESPAEALTADEWLTLSNLVDRLKQPTLP